MPAPHDAKVVYGIEFYSQRIETSSGSTLLGFRTTDMMESSSITIAADERIMGLDSQNNQRSQNGTEIPSSGELRVRTKRVGEVLHAE